MELGLLLVGGYVLYKTYETRLNQEDRAAETFPTKIDEKKPGEISAPASRPTVLQPASEIASLDLAVGMPSIVDTSHETYEQAVKVLNISKQFRY